MADPSAIPPSPTGSPPSPSSPDHDDEAEEDTSDPSANVTPVDPVLRAHITALRLLFTAWLTHFRTLGYIKEATMDNLDKTVLRKILTLSVRDAKAREAFGTSVDVWTDMLELLRVAVPSLEGRSYGTIPTEYNTNPDGTTTATGQVYDAPAANVIVSHHVSLLRDLQRLNNILCIARNILTAGTTVQNLAAKLSVDREVCCLVNLCVKTTARGYDGDGREGDEDRWQAVVNEFKKLLITCLQFLSNLVTLNERLKLMLWVELFDGSSEGNVPGWHDPAGAVRPGYGGKTAQADEEGEDAWVASATGRLLSGRDASFETRRDSEGADLDDISPEDFWKEPKAAVVEARLKDVYDSKWPQQDTQPRSPTPPRSRSRTAVRRKSSSSQRKRSPRPPTVYLLWLYERKDGIRDQLRTDLGTEPTMREVLARATSLWEKMDEAGKVAFQQARAKELDQWHRELRTWKRDVKSWMATHGIDFDVEDSLHQAATQDRLGDILSEMAEAADAADGLKQLPALDAPTSRSELGTASLFDREVSPVHPAKGTMENAQDGIEKLEEGKRGLLKRLADSAAQAHELDNRQPPMAENLITANTVSPSSPVESPMSASKDNPYAVPEEDIGVEDELEPEDEEEELESDEVDDESSEDDDYDRIPGEEGRGLLTDVPLILGPNEIEVLPMIIMSGIVTDHNQVKQKQAESTNDQLQVFLNMYTIRCHLLLAQENGRNLLRELLIFVAAWDLREEELYFKFMVKIMESILLHGLMPFAYSAFKESKDIISPAQAVIMKLLTKIFHSRQAFIDAPKAGDLPEGATPHPATGWGEEATAVVPRGSSLSSDTQNQNDVTHENGGLKAASPGQERAEKAVMGATSIISTTAPWSLSSSDPTRTIVSTLFSEFRSNIIPQICALIFLQGQIRVDHASIEDFPLNLWDMERMYEGVYQYLEFFAILTDHDEWKTLMAEWEVVSELVTLLRELESGIGKVARRHPQPTTDNWQNFDPKNLEFENEEDKRDHEALVEHLKRESDKAEKELKQMRAARSAYSQDPAATNGTPTSRTPVSVERPFEPLPPPPTNRLGRNPQAFAAHGSNSPSGSSSQTPSPPGASGALHEEPADFEWRNLKKLCVLVLSSLVWRNKPLQDQVLRFGGVDVLLRCCTPDAHNPYIREHAIMCLRFLVEGNEDVRARVQFLDEVEKKRQIWDERRIRRDEDRMMERAARRKAREMARVNKAAAEQEDDDESDDSADMDAEAAANGEPQSDLDEPDGSDPVATAAAYDEPIVVPPEVLDDHGYETFMDGAGQVGLRRKGVPRRRKFGPFFSRQAHVPVTGGELPGAETEVDGLGPPSNADWDAIREVYGGDEGTPSTVPKPFDGYASGSDDTEDEMDEEEEQQAGAGLDEGHANHDIPEALRPGRKPEGVDKGKGRAQPELTNGARETYERPRTAADLPAWVEAITRDLPHKKAEALAKRGL